MSVSERLQRVSDRTDERVTSAELVTIAIRKHPDLEAGVAKRLEIARKELVDLPGWRDAVLLEVHLPGQKNPIHISCSAADFDKFLHPDVVAQLSDYQGRPKGLRPGIEIA